MRTRRKPEIVNNIPHKHCTQCSVLKPLDAFYADRRYLDGRTSACKQCRITAALPRHYLWRNENKDKVKQHSKTSRHNKLQSKYGVSFEDACSVLQEQDGQCAICEKEVSFDADDRRDKPHVDHDHVTGQFRGLLCLTCNVGLGMLGDSTELLTKAIGYLRTSLQRERLSELAPETGDAIVCSHGNENHEKPAEMTGSTAIH